jgi:hypothetical protein
VDEGISDKLRHALDTGSMCPVRVMDRCESDGSTLIVSWILRRKWSTHSALESGQQHVRSIEGMYEIRRESSRLLLRRNFRGSTRVGDVNSLKSSHDLFLDCLSVWLDDRESKWCGPNDGCHELLR